jgi:hypothetical protein
LLYDHREVKNANTHLSGNVSILRYIHFKLHVARAEIFPVGYFLATMVLVCVDSVLIGCDLLGFGRREVPQLRGTKEIRMIRGDLYLRLDMEVKESDSM